MDFNNFDTNYNNFIDFLYAKQDLDYKKFHLKLLNNENINLIGIRTPILKDIAKSIAKTDYLTFFKNNRHLLYEEILLHGLVIGYIKAPFNDVLALLNNFIPFVDNWAVNDIVCANLKCFKNNLSEGYNYIKTLIGSNNEWYIRFGIVLLLDFYINDDYIDSVLKICSNIKNNSYYVKMAVAWCLSICFIKYKDKTYNILKSNKLDEFTYSKTISKICDSNRVDKNTKLKLKERII